MNLDEIKERFNFEYDAASNGGPDIDDYEMSLCLTKAVDAIYEKLLTMYEEDDSARNNLSSQNREHKSVIRSFGDKTSVVRQFYVSKPSDCRKVVREDCKLLNCVQFPKVEIASAGDFNDYFNNPFKWPNDRKVIRTDKDEEDFHIYANQDVISYTIKYLRQKTEPIIVSDLPSNLTINGISEKTNTTLPENLMPDIISFAVAEAIKTVRSNNLNTKK